MASMEEAGRWRQSWPVPEGRRRAGGAGIVPRASSAAVDAIGAFRRIGRFDAASALPP